MRRYNATLTQATTTVTISLNDNEDVQVLLVQGSGNRLVTWAGVTTWLTPTGVAPTLKTTAGASDLLTFSRTGATTYGLVAGSAGAAGSAGSTGPAGINWRGTYSAGTTYAPHDAVFSSGSSFLCLTTAIGVTPGSDATVWAVLAAGGSGTSTGGGEFVDSFTRADVASLVSQSPPTSPWNYTALQGTQLGISSNMCVDANTSGANQLYRAEQAMASVDHHAQITVGTFVTPTLGVVAQYGVSVRFSSSANTNYTVVMQGQNTAGSWLAQIYKVVTGTFTPIGSASAAFSALPTAGATLKLSVLGTALVAYYNGVQIATATDSAIAGGTQAGLFMNLGGSGLAGSKISEFRFGA